MATPCLPAMAIVCDPLGTVGDAAGDAAGAVAGSAAQVFVNSFADGFASLVKTMTTFWVDVPTPALGGGPGSPAGRLQGLVYGVQGCVLVASLLYVAGKTALNRNGQAAADGARGLGVMVVAVGAGVAAVDVLAAAGDAWSAWVIDTAADGDIGTRLGTVAGGSAAMTGLGLGVTFVVALLGIISCLAQIFFLLARVAVLTLLVGTLPLSAAALSTPAGRAWFQRTLGWIIAFLLYKPVAALVYAGAFTLAGSGTDTLSVLSGLMLIVLAVFALPALMRLTAPMVAAASGGGGGAVGGALAGAALATGAKNVSQHASSSSSSPSRPGGSTSGAGGSTSGAGGSGGGRGSGPSGSGSAGGGSAGGGSTGGGPSGSPSGAAPAGGSAAAGARATAGTGAGGAAGGGAAAGAGAGAAGLAVAGAQAAARGARGVADQAGGAA